MKTNIDSIIDMIIRDNSSFIYDNGGNIADYLILSAQSEDHGYAIYLTDDENIAFDQDNNMRSTLIKEVEAYIKENFNYAPSDLKCYQFIDDYKGNQIFITEEDNFKKVNLCESYNEYGQKVGCYDAGCYCLDNSYSPFLNDLLSALDEKLNTNYSNNHKHSSCTNVENLFEMIEPSDEEKDFINDWISDNEIHSEIKAWTYYNGHNFNTLCLENYDMPCRKHVEELSDDINNKILSEYFSDNNNWSNWSGGFRYKETENYIFTQSQWQGDVFTATVELK